MERVRKLLVRDPASVPDHVSLRHGPTPAARSPRRSPCSSSIAGLGFLVSRSITRPLGEVSEGARMLPAGLWSSSVSYAGRDASIT